MATKSIMPTERGTCYICGCNQGYESHHCLHGRANRQIAEREGLKVWLCRECHRLGRYAVHKCKSTDLLLEQDAQTVWEANYIKNGGTDEEARSAFMTLFGKNYIYD